MKPAILITLVLLCAACKEISFRTPQPSSKRSLHAVPAKLHGKYVAPNEPDDTVVIDAGGYRIIPADPDDEIEAGYLGDSLVLKRHRGYYFFNHRNSHGWTLAVVKRQKGGDLSYLLMEQEGLTFDEYLTRLSMEIPVDSVPVDGTMRYYIDPSPSELISLLREGFFRERLLLKRTAD